MPKMSPISLAVAVLIAACLVPVHGSVDDCEWEQYKTRYGKTYDDPQVDAFHRKLYERSKQTIEKLEGEPNRTSELELNHLADWSDQQLASLRMNLTQSRFGRPMCKRERAKFLRKYIRGSINSAPHELDWRQAGNRVAPVRNQMRCGSCWAFAAVGVLEGQQVAKGFTQELVPLSVQQLVDCSWSNWGCRGGWSVGAMDDIHSMGGLQAESSYPYENGQLANCQFRGNESAVVMSVAGGLTLELGDPELIKTLLANYGPIAVVMHSSTRDFHLYKSGVYQGKHCESSTNSDHALLLVGYGTSKRHGDYWLVKNSWGSNWGEEGYFRIKRGKNVCNIEQELTVALF